MTPRTARAHAFAVTHFGACDAHRSHAQTVYEQLDKLAKGRGVSSLAPDDTIAEVLGHISDDDRLAGDSLDRVELQMALEEELSHTELVRRAVDARIAEHVLDTLLGPLRQANHWDPQTVWLRSVRGIVNERVRHSGGCTCAPIDAPSKNQMQRTKHC
jgi:hypothetical protein